MIGIVCRGFRCVCILVTAMPCDGGKCILTYHPTPHPSTHQHPHPQAAGLTPDVVSHSVLIKAHALSGDLEGALRLLEAMVAEGRVAPTHRTFNPLVDRCARAGACRGKGWIVCVCVDGWDGWCLVMIDRWHHPPPPTYHTTPHITPNTQGGPTSSTAFWRSWPRCPQPSGGRSGLTW